MMNKLKFILVFVGCILYACGLAEKKLESNSSSESKLAPINQDTLWPVMEGKIIMEKQIIPLQGIPDSSFVRIADYSEDFSYDMRYATDNNFLKKKVYPCAECYVRAKTAKALIKANTAFVEKGYRIHFFDCYRPNSVQYKMWEIFPNPQYVANPVKGSIHNRGGAVDISLTDLSGRLLNMGTDFDFFGIEAHHDFKDLPEEVLKNRTLLKSTLEAYGFNSIRTEWWHYNLSGTTSYPIADFVWDCE